MAKLSFYGGVGQIGGNKILLEDQDSRLFLDFGTPFAERGRFYEEYLKPRSAFGLLDPLTMNLLPPLHGLYRADLEQSLDGLWDDLRGSPLYRDLRQSPIDALLLSHAHLDHSGYISFLRDDIPILSTALTAFISKAVQDSGRGDFEAETVYWIPRELSDSGFLESGNYRRVAAQQRSFRLFDYGSISASARTFWEDIPGSRALDAKPLEPVVHAHRLEVRSFPVDHSIPGASAFAIKTSVGWVAYTGDLRFHGRNGDLTRRFCKEMQALRPVALICEGTRAGRGSTGSPNFSEQAVHDNALRAVRNASGLVIADFGARNVERLQAFLEIAQETGRLLVITPRDAYLLWMASLVDHSIPSVGTTAHLFIYDEPKSRLDGWERVVREQYPSRLLPPEAIRRSQRDYILCLSFYDLDGLPTLKPEDGSLYLYSSNEAFNEEIQIDFRRLRAWIEHFGMRHIGLPLEELDWKVPAGEEGLHASGHSDSEGLVRLVSEVMPGVIIPVHTERRGLQFFQEQMPELQVQVVAPHCGAAIDLDQVLS